MIELVVSVCLADDPTRCKDVSLIFDEMSAAQCMMMSPVQIAKWSESHPKWVAKRWTCRPAGSIAKI